MIFGYIFELFWVIVLDFAGTVEQGDEFLLSEALFALEFLPDVCEVFWLPLIDSKVEEQCHEGADGDFVAALVIA